MSHMVDPVSISQVGGASNAPRAPAGGTAESGPAFRALLDQLADRARELEKTSTKDVAASELSGAVDEARDSLQGALQLIEAYRAKVQSAAAGTPKNDQPR
ncbi:MAG: hypothetical protein JNL28_09475 [Planctomycetes bacterium]|nr:hypothetical protein [Planctomycetota bacterium]